METSDEFLTREPSTDWDSWSWPVFGAAIVVGAVVATIPAFITSLIAKVT